MNSVDKQYFDLLNYILTRGVVKQDRTGTGTISVFDYTMRFDMSEGFPCLTSKKMYFKGIIYELVWFLGNHMRLEKYSKFGLTNIKYLVDNNVNIWVGDAYKNYIKRVSDPITKEEFVDRIKNDDDFASTYGDLGPVYGHQWINWGGYKTIQPDYSQEIGYNTFGGGRNIVKSAPLVEVEVKGINQVQSLIDDLKNNPDSRRLMVNAWNVSDMDKCVLPPCHYGFQCYTREMTIEERVDCANDIPIYSKFAITQNDGRKMLLAGVPEESYMLDKKNFPKRKLDMKWTQRSVDTPLGLPYNISSYAILLHLIANEVNMIPGDLIFSGGDVHIYLNQIDAIKEQLNSETFDLPTIKIANKSIWDIMPEDIELVDYKSAKTIKIELSN